MPSWVTIGQTVLASLKDTQTEKHKRLIIIDILQFRFVLDEKLIYSQPMITELKVMDNYMIFTGAAWSNG